MNGWLSWRVATSIRVRTLELDKPYKTPAPDGAGAWRKIMAGMTQLLKYAPRGRLSIVASALMLLALQPMTARADATDGWRDVSGGIEHYSGLRCPDRVANLARIDATTTTEFVLASCTYQANRMHGVLEIISENILGDLLAGIRDRFLLSGFPQAAGVGASGKGLTFIVATKDGLQTRETVWPIRIGATDYILWLNYKHPLADAEVDVAYQSFVDLLRASQPAK